MEKDVKATSQNKDLPIFLRFFAPKTKEIAASILEKTAIVIPCYNEKENLSSLLPQIVKTYPKVHIYLVDDGSTDGTRELILEFGKKHKNIHLFTREKKDGLGSAYVYSFAKLLKETSHEFFIQMDGDGSHDPYFLQSLLGTAETADVVIGSRYVGGVCTLQWPMHRLLMSYLTNVYYKIVTRTSIRDFTSGFKCFRRKVLETIDLSKITPEGFFFQVEMNILSLKLGFSVVEVPIIFLERTHGISKMDWKVLLETVLLGAFLPFRNYERTII